MQDVKQQRAYCTIRKTALACLKELEGLLCGEEQQLISAKPDVHAQLLSDMRGTEGREKAPAQTPHLLRTPQTAGKATAGQASTQAPVHVGVLLPSAGCLQGSSRHSKDERTSPSPARE